MIEVIGSKIDSYSLKDSFVQGEQGSDAITFKLNAALTGYTWRVRGTINGYSTESADISPTESASSVQVAWTPTGAFTAQAGMLYLTLVGKKSNGTIINKAIGSVEILPDMAMQSAGTITQSLFEQLVAQCSASAQDSEAWAVGKRSGADVPSTDPTYHNNAKYWAQQASITDYSSLTNKPSINSITLSGNKTAADLNLITDPATKSSGQLLKYNGSAWAAANESVTSVNGRTGNITINKALSTTVTTTSWTQSGNYYTKSVTVQGVTATNTITVSPDPEYYEDWAECQMRASAQGANSVTFKCKTLPSRTLTANVLITEAVTTV